MMMTGGTYPENCPIDVVGLAVAVAFTPTGLLTQQVAFNVCTLLLMTAIDVGYSYTQVH